ncbi:MAG: aminotransferase class V-fold PLP-dependent enzyme [Pirellulaceae bacterium]
MTTQIEHNSVLRPLAWLKQSRNVASTIVPCDQFGFIDPDEIRRAIQPQTRLIVISHASNVTGALQDLSMIGAIVRDSPAKLLVDAAQSFGHFPIDVRKMNIDMLAASGHKGALGPLGTAFTFIDSTVGSEVAPLLHGGTGNQSELPTMPQSMPWRHEAGNLNVPGIAGLMAALQWRKSNSIADQSTPLGNQLAERLRVLPNVRVIRDQSRTHLPVVSIVIEGWEPTDVASVLESNFGIQVRAGLHCAPRIHKAIDAPQGTVRLSLGRFNTQPHIDLAVEAITQIATCQ